MTGHLRRRFPHKGDEIGSNYMSSRKHDVSSLKDLPTASWNDESMPRTTATEGDLNVIMETSVDLPLPSDLVASTVTQDAFVEADISGTTEAQTNLNDKKLHQRFPIKDDKIASDHWPPEKHDESSDDDSSDSEDESMRGCTSVGNDAAEPFPNVIKEDEVVSSHSSPHEHDDASSSQEDPRHPLKNESMPGATSAKVDWIGTTMTEVGHSPKPNRSMSRRTLIETYMITSKKGIRRLSTDIITSISEYCRRSLRGICSSPNQ